MRAKGTRIGRYEIDSLIGSGGMGDVYRAHDSELHRHVALKMIRATDDDAITRFMREARSAARLSHPHAVTVFDVGRTDDGPWIAMELIEGRTLREAMEGRRAPLEERVQWLREIAEVLKAAHEAGIVHRDIKPENVMIRPDGTSKVLDFGVARAPSLETKHDPTLPQGKEDFATLTSEGAIIGTVSYMAPEQLRGDPIDGRADQFSWGVVAFELFAGKLPWQQATNAVKLLSQILSVDAPSPRAAGASIPQSLDRVVHRALSRDADDRYPDMKALLADLERAEAEVVATAGALPPTLPAAEDVSPRAPEHTDSPVSRTERSDPERKASRSRPLFVGVIAAGAALAIGAVLASMKHAGSIADAQAPLAAEAAAPPPEERSRCANAEADRTYEDGLRLWRTESEQRGVAAMERAVEIDPTCGGPKLRIALYYYAFDPARGRVLYATARGNRSSLSERDVLLLDAAGPYFDDPPNAKEWLERTKAIATARPQDATVAFDEAYAAWRAADANASLAAATRAIAIAPDHVRARWLSAIVRAELLRDLDGAIRELEKCIELHPSASSCHGERAQLLVEQGRCEELERSARTWLARSPTAAGPRLTLATALAATNQTKESIDEVWSAALEHLPPSRKDEERVRGRARLAFLYGDLEGTESALTEWIAIAKKREDVSGRLGPAAELAVLYAETDRAADAARIANEHLAREPGLQRDENVWWMTTQDVPIAASLVLAVAGGHVDQAKARRAAWHAQANALEAKGRVPKGFGWITTDARFARTPEEAKEALALPEAQAALGERLPAQLAAWVGGVKALAGDAKGALPLLRKANAACDTWLWPAGERVRAVYLRGVAAADAGEVEEAKAALGHVADRWPQTRLGRAAKTRLRTLR